MEPNHLYYAEASSSNPRRWPPQIRPQGYEPPPPPAIQTAPIYPVGTGVDAELDFMTTSSFSGWHISQTEEGAPWTEEDEGEEDRRMSAEPSSASTSQLGLSPRYQAPHAEPQNTQVPGFRAIAPNPASARPYPIPNRVMADPYGNIPPPYMGPPNAPTHPQDSPSIEFAPFFGDFVPISSPTPQDDQLAAIEEEKRRRNTAASARFRIKKKEREQALEQTAAEMTEKVVGLEAKVGQLELENKWLRGLITEKSKNVVGGKAGESSKKDSKGKKSEDKSRGPGKHTDGVGTA